MKIAYEINTRRCLGYEIEEGNKEDCGLRETTLLGATMIASAADLSEYPSDRPEPAEEQPSPSDDTDEVTDEPRSEK